MLAGAQATQNLTWTDPDTGLMWAREDNGSDIDWSRARDYCSELQLAGYNDWRLPTIEELQGIDDPGASVFAVLNEGAVGNMHVKGNLKLSGWQWSSSPGDPSRGPWYFSFIREGPGDGFPLGFSYSMRALCVRRTAELLVKADADCNWKLDGQPMEPLKAKDPRVFPISPGQHRIRAATTDGVTKTRIDFGVDQGQRFVEILLKDEHEKELNRQRAEAIRKQAEAEAALHPTWTDPATGLMWARKDNGSDVSWEQARDYCAKSELAGYKDWRLPTIEELEGIYDSSVSVPSVFDEDWILPAAVKGDLRLSGWAWSSTQGHYPDTPQPVAKVFNFAKLHEDESGSFPLVGFNYSTRALCVRRSGE